MKTQRYGISNKEFRLVLYYNEFTTMVAPVMLPGYCVAPPIVRPIPKIHVRWRMLRLRRLLRRLESTLHLSAVNSSFSFSFGLNSFFFFILFLLIRDLQIDCLDSTFTLLPCIGDMSVLAPAPEKYSKKRPEKKALKFFPPIRNKIFMDAIVSSSSAPLSSFNFF